APAERFKCTGFGAQLSARRRQGSGRAMDNRVTECPRCGTSFRVTAAHLTVAAGAVRCGSCLHIFNALENWVEEEPVAATAVTEPAHDAPDYTFDYTSDYAPDYTPDEPVEVRTEPELGDLAWETLWDDSQASAPDSVAAQTEFT